MTQDRHPLITTSTDSPAPGGRPQGVVFDCDGVLVDTASCWEAAYRQTLRQHGRRLGNGRLAKLNGASVRAAAEQLKVPADELNAALEAAFESGTIRVLPGVRPLLEQLEGTPRGVATNCPRKLASRALTAVGIAEYFDVVASAETLRDKPAPDVYLAACRALRVKPEECVAIEDSAIGVAAARSAGLTVVYIPALPDTPAEADLCIPRLDDPQLLRLLTVPARASSRS
jgi:HAD superfamily hydrolase (TIGR01509 family)